MKRVLLALSVVLMIGCSTVGNLPLITRIPGDRREFEIVRVDYAPSRAAARITFSSPSGIFAFDLDPGGRELKRLTFIVKDQRYCEGLNFQDRSGHTTDLLRTKGVQVRQEGADLVMDVTPPAVDVLKNGGRVQFVNQFR